MSKMKTNQIECPNCGTTIDVNEALSKHLRKENEAALAKERQKLAREREEFERIQNNQDSEIEKKVGARLSKARGELAEKLQAKFNDEYKDQIEGLTKELDTKSDKLKDFHKLEAEKSKLEREKSELEAQYKAESERLITEASAQARKKALAEEADKSELKIREREKTIEDLKGKLKEAAQRAEQGSGQLQGEVQELAIEEWLAGAFPLDTIEEIKKGARGGDCIQIVNTRQRTNCGTVYYESKRTKHFQPEWIEKFKNDVRRKNADIGVLVTETMPTDMPRMGLRDGIWVCTYQEFKGLSFVMREMIVRLDAATTTSKNKGDKMGMLYDFLTSNEFRLQMETIVTGFTTMQIDLEREKRSMQTSWKRREKQIRRVIESTADMYGSIQGIAGAALPSIESLALPEGEQ